MDRIKQIAFLKIYDVWFDFNKFKSSKYAITALHTNDRLEKKIMILNRKQKLFC